MTNWCRECVQIIDKDERFCSKYCKEKYGARFDSLSSYPWYHKWNRGKNPILWALRTTLLKLDDMGLIHLKIGQLFKFRDLLG
jgi:hypothetical protein